MRKIAAWTAIVSGVVLFGVYLGFSVLAGKYTVVEDYGVILTQVVPALGVIEVLMGLGLLIQKGGALQMTVLGGMAVAGLLVTGHGLQQLPTGTEYGTDVEVIHPIAASWGNGTPTDELNRTFMGVASFIEHVITTKGAERKLQETVRRQQQSYENLRFSTPPDDYD